MKTYITIMLIIISTICTMKAEIIYKNIDSTLSATPQEKNDYYVLDFNNDGINDFCLWHENEFELKCGISSLQSNGDILIDGNNTAYNCKKGQMIGEEPINSWENTYSFLGWMNSYWKTGKEGIIAVRFHIDSKFHYGWIRVKVPINNKSMNIIDCAYEDIPEDSIPAGETTSSSIDNKKDFNMFVLTNQNIVINNDNNFELANLKIYNVNGSCIFSLSKNELSTNRFINISDFCQGCYFVVFESENSIRIGKFLK